ncbi:MAG: hypothetical protein E7678_03020 [Ruminococcaceae bacterium]|nr:hypothetical protein [Oscillospiraceae bacterium]
MRKLLTVLALVLTVALCASFAVSAADPEVTKMELGSTSKDVSFTYNSVSEDTDTKIYSVDVTWNDVSFSYNAGTTQWNPDKHDYSAAGAGAAWTDDEGSVTVTNHSNASVAVAVEFVSASNGSATIDVTNGEFTLESAVGKLFAEADAKSATLSADGAPTSNAKIGSIKVTISAN